MRFGSFVGVFVASLVGLLAGVPSARAENDDRLRRPQFFQGYGAAPAQERRPVRRPLQQYQQAPAPAYRQVYPQQYYYYQGRPYYPGMPVYRAPGAPVARQPAPAPREVRRPSWFENRDAQQTYQPPREARQVEPAPRPRRPRPVPAAPQAAQVQVEPTIFVTVFGDSLGATAAQGLGAAYEDVDEIEVVNKTRPNSGLARDDHHDWPKAIRDYLASEPKITAAVMMLGVNDRQAIREGETSHEPLSDRWRQLYRDRVDAVIAAFSERKVPVIWIGTPPMRNERLSADLIALNDIYRERVERAGGTYIDIWPGFIDDENRYTVSGPDVEGQTRRLRTNDGVHFTEAGARKIAHFAESELKRIFEKGNAAAVAALSGGAPVTPSNVEQIIDAALPALPELPGTPPLSAKPLAGPVVPLTRVDTSPGGTLAKTAPPLDADAGHIAERALKQGVAPAPKPGRADDFRWSGGT